MTVIRTSFPPGVAAAAGAAAATPAARVTARGRPPIDGCACAHPILPVSPAAPSLGLGRKAQCASAMTRGCKRATPCC